jgi:Ca2+-binding EF-hand superfamily protein
MEFLQLVGVEIKNRRLLIKPFFQDKDKSSSGFITATRFRSIFDSQKLPLTEAQLGLIMKRFQAKAANEINYVEFDHFMKRFE